MPGLQDGYYTDHSLPPGVAHLNHQEKPPKKKKPTFHSTMLQPRDVIDAGLSPQGKEIIGLAVVAVFLAGILVALRFYTRGFWLRVLGREDWSIGLALVSHPAEQHTSWEPHPANAS